MMTTRYCYPRARWTPQTIDDIFPRTQQLALLPPCLLLVAIPSRRQYEEQHRTESITGSLDRLTICWYRYLDSYIHGL